MSQFNQTFITLIVNRYRLDLDDRPIDTIVVTWLQTYDRDWIVKAIVESIRRGRYKVRSVDSILMGWQRLGSPVCTFTPEYEREILQNLPVIPPPDENRVIPILSSPDPEPPVTPHVVFNSEDLNPEESAPFQHYKHSGSAIPARSIPSEPLVSDKEDCSFATIGSTSLTSLPSRSYFGLAGVDANLNSSEVTNRIVSQPAKFQLFQTLKAIVEPKNYPIADIKTFDSSPSSTDDRLTSFTNFEYSLGNASGE